MAAFSRLQGGITRSLSGGHIEASRTYSNIVYSGLGTDLDLIEIEGSEFVSNVVRKFGLKIRSSKKIFSAENQEGKLLEV